jgi:hypothetical protein
MSLATHDLALACGTYRELRAESGTLLCVGSRAKAEPNALPSNTNGDGKDTRQLVDTASAFIRETSI